MDILKQAERILTRSSNRKPQDIPIAQADWNLAEPETRQLILECRRLNNAIDNLYLQARYSRDFETALYAHEHLMTNPTLCYANFMVYSKQECLENQADYQKRAKFWILSAKHLLGEEIA